MADAAVTENRNLKRKVATLGTKVKFLQQQIAKAKVSGPVVPVSAHKRGTNTADAATRVLQGFHRLFSFSQGAGGFTAPAASHPTVDLNPLTHSQGALGQHSPALQRPQQRVTRAAPEVPRRKAADAALPTTGQGDTVTPEARDRKLR